MSELMSHPAVITATSVIVTLLVMGAFWLFKKKKMNFDFLLPPITTIIQSIFGNAQATNPAEAVKADINSRLSKEELALLSRHLATHDPVQKIYETITIPAREAGEKDGSNWIKQVASGLTNSAIAGLARGLTKKLF